MLIIQGKKDTSGEVTVSGSKNAALPIIAAALLVKHVRLTNVPDIADIHLFLEIVKSMGSKVTFEDNVLEMDNSNLSVENLAKNEFKHARATYYFLPVFLHLFGEADIPYPGGCNLGKRPVNHILRSIEKMGYQEHSDEQNIRFVGKPNDKNEDLHPYFSVGNTAILLLASIFRPGTTRLNLAAFEPHIINLIDFLRSAGANIAIRYDHTILVTGVKKLHDSIDFEVISDYLQSGTFMAIAALSARDHVDIHRARIGDLTAYLAKLHAIGVHTEDLGDDSIRVFRGHDLKCADIQTNIYPGFPTDLQSPFAVLLTQSEGKSHFHEVLFEGRLNWMKELTTMGADIQIENDHEAYITGATPLQGTTVASHDLRSGAAMVVAGIIAQGETQVTNINHIKRGYEDFVGKLQAIGVDIHEMINNQQ